MAAALRLVLLSGLWLGLAACTPGHTVATGQTVARKLHLHDGVEVARGNQRVLSRQAQVCLAADQRLQSRGLLEIMQQGFSGYFVAVGIDSAPQDYASVLLNPPCQGAHYIFYVNFAEVPCSAERAADGQCAEQRPPRQLIVTILNRDDRTLADRIAVEFSRGLFPLRSEQERLREAFAQLAALLTGAGSGA